MVVDWLNGNRVEWLKIKKRKSDKWANVRQSKVGLITILRSYHKFSGNWSCTIYFSYIYFLCISSGKCFVYLHKLEVNVHLDTYIHSLCKTCSIYQTGCYSMLHHHNCSQVYCFHHHRNCHGSTQVIHILLSHLVHI